MTTITTDSETVKQPSQLKGPLEDSKKCPPSYPKYKFYQWEFETPLKWSNIILTTLWHLITLYGLMTIPFLEKPGLIIYIFVLILLSGFGTTGGVHRYYTHRSYKAKLPLRIFLLVCFSMSGQYSVVDWVRDHRVHHKFSETDADPHNSNRGFFFAHVGWLMMKRHPEVLRKGKTVDISDLYEDPAVVFHQKYFSVLKLLFCFVIPTLIPPLFFGESWYTSIMAICFVRYILCLNLIWTVNSLAHIWGNKPYDKKISPSENLAVALFTFGEGYHNYHHTFPWDYRASEMGKLLNLTTFALNVCEKFGWAYDMKFPSEELLKKVVQNHGDGSHYRWGHEVSILENDAVELKKK